MSEQFLLATNELINLDLRYTLRSMEQEFAFLDYQLHVEDSDKIKLLNIVCKNIEFKYNFLIYFKVKTNIGINCVITYVNIFIKTK